LTVDEVKAVDPRAGRPRGRPPGPTCKPPGPTCRSPGLESGHLAPHVIRMQVPSLLSIHACKKGIFLGLREHLHLSKAPPHTINREAPLSLSLAPLYPLHSLPWGGAPFWVVLPLLVQCLVGVRVGLCMFRSGL